MAVPWAITACSNRGKVHGKPRQDAHGALVMYHRASSARGKEEDLAEIQAPKGLQPEEECALSVFYGRQ
jgi:hypothetical protein